MGVIENIGEAAIRALDKLAAYSVDALIRIIRFTRRIDFYPYFQGRGIERRDYMVLKVQMASLGFLFAAVLFVFGFLEPRVFALFFLVLGGYSLYLIPKLREHFKEDFNAYRDFFLGFMGVPVLLVLFKSSIPIINPLFPYIHLLFLSIAYILVFSYLFKRKYGRDYTYGRVIEGGNPAKVKLNYDIRASVKPGVVRLDNLYNADEGVLVKIEVEKSRLNLRGSRAVKILGIEETLSTGSART